MNEKSNKKNVSLDKPIFIKTIVISIAVLALTILLNLKPAVNNIITKVYYIVSVISFVGMVLFYAKIQTSNVKESLINIYYNFVDTLSLFVVACCVFQTIFVFGYFKANVDGTSMVPTFEEGQTLIVRSNKDVENFDVVVVEYDSEKNNFAFDLKTGDLLVKRLIGKAGDTFYFDDGVLYLNGTKYEEDYINSYFTKTFTLGNYHNYKGVVFDEEKNCYVISDGYYFVMGDNRNISNDSRQLGLFDEEQLIGRVDFELHSLFDWY